MRTQEINSDGHPKPRSLCRLAVPTTATALDYTFDPEVDYELMGITVHATGAISDDFTVTLDSGEGADYDAVLKNITGGFTDLSISCKDEYYSGNAGVPTARDRLKLSCANTATETIGVVIYYRII